jgi:hypothetical protein
MATFRDQLDRSWTLNITVIEVKKIKKEFELDFNEFASGDGRVIQRLATDTVLLVDVLSTLLEDQIKQRGLDERQFAQGMVGVGIEAATDALVEAVVNFSKPQAGRVIRAVYAKMQATTSLASARVMTRLEDLNVEELVNSQIDKALTLLPKKFGG